MRRNRSSRLDIKEAEKTYIVTAEIPGYSMKDIKIDIRGNTLIISSKVKEEKEKTEKGYIVKEKSQKSFRRSITIPKGIRAEDISANLDKGILSITIPKVSKSTKFK
jgi:HSP20 family protein